jgi:hypothetical protein
MIRYHNAECLFDGVPEERATRPRELSESGGARFPLTKPVHRSSAEFQRKPKEIAAF